MKTNKNLRTAVMALLVTGSCVVTQVAATEATFPVEEFLAKLKSDDVSVRREAIRLYNNSDLYGPRNYAFRHEHKALTRAVVDALERESDPALKVSMMAIEVGLYDPEALDTLLFEVEHGRTAKVRQGAISVLGEILDAVGYEAGRAYGAALQDVDSKVRRAAAKNLARGSGYLPEDALFAALKADDVHVRQSAARALGKVQAFKKKAVIALIDALGDTDKTVRLRSAKSLGNLGYRQAAPALRRSLRDASYGVRLAAAKSLSQWGDQRAFDMLLDALGERDGDAAQAAKYLEDLGDPRAIGPLKTALQREGLPSHVASSMTDALRELEWTVD